jgi:hypothetical protein
VFAGREALGREGLRGRKGDDGGQKGEEGGRRSAVEVWGGGGGGVGGRWREGKEDGKETNHITQKNKSIMQDDKECNKISPKYATHKYCKKAAT